ncbi:hypothetical protein [Maridesulfovibrio sp.]|uniref:hypothetical protein n=1 Tax=Maridesulfovibrio sp. TaxID=2795000 RepID=UPI002A18BAA4|nr:hypothetical protein [Maridesulfovibrio sp.]
MQNIDCGISSALMPDVVPCVSTARNKKSPHKCGLKEKWTGCPAQHGLFFSAAGLDESDCSHSHCQTEKKPEKAHILTPPFYAYQTGFLSISKKEAFE